MTKSELENAILETEMELEDIESKLSFLRQQLEEGDYKS